MLKLVLKWIVFAGIIMATCYLPGIKVENFAFAMLVAFDITIFNVFIKPIVKILAIPINLLTFGLFNLILNIAILYAISYFIPQYELTNITSAFIASIIITISYCTLKKMK